MSKPSNITELRNELLDVFDEVRKDPRRINQAKEVANVAGKIIGTLKAQLEHAALCEIPDIPFMGETSGVSILKGPFQKVIEGNTK